MGNTIHYPFPCPLASDEVDTVLGVADKVPLALSALHVLPLQDTLQEPDLSCRAFGYSRRNKLFRTVVWRQYGLLRLQVQLKLVRLLP